MRLTVVAAVLLASPALAHEWWLEASTWRVKPGTEVAVSGNVGTGFVPERLPARRDRAVRLEARGAGGTDLMAAMVEESPELARLIPQDRGGVLVAYESNFARIELAAADFEAYLRDEGLDAPLAARERFGTGATPGRERYARCAKAWIAGNDASRLTEPVGLTLELVPDAAPRRGEPLGLRLLLRGRPLEGALVRAWRAPAGDGARPSVSPVREGRTDAAGRVRLDAPGKGEWLVSVVHMEGSEDLDAADWQSFWSSLTFAL